MSEERGGPSQSKPACTVISEPCEPSLSRTALDEMSEQEEEEDDETGDETNDDTDIQGKVKVAHHLAYNTDVSDRVKILMSIMWD